MVVHRAAALRTHVLDGAAQFSLLRLRGVAGALPGGQAAGEGVGAVALVPQPLRHTGAGLFVRSGAVGDDRALAGQLAPAPVELGGRDADGAVDRPVETPPRIRPDDVEDDRLA